MTLAGAQAFGADTPGETFVFDWTETVGSNVGLTGMVNLTLGPAGTGGLFDVSSFDVTSKGGFCGICTPKSEILTGVSFDSTTNGLVGDITGSYVNGKGRTHTFDLTLVDLPMATWTFADTGPGGLTTTSMGTYTTKTGVTSVDEPETLLLLIPAIGGLAVSLRRRRRAAAS
jgi:hypothetical protein